MESLLRTTAAAVAITVLIVMTNALGDVPEYDIVVGDTIDVDNPEGLVYRDDGFWVMKQGSGPEWRLQHYSTSGVLVSQYELPGSVSRNGLAWDGTYWWISDNNYGSDTIYKCVLDELNGIAVPVASYSWPHTGPVGLEWAEGKLWVSDNHTDIIYRVTVGGSSLTLTDWCSTNPAPYGLAWDGANMWSVTGPAGGGAPGEREIYKHDTNGDIIEIWHYPPADDPNLGSYGGYATGIAFANGQMWYCDYDKDQIIQAIPAPGAAVLGMIGIGMVGAYTRKRRLPDASQ